MVHQGKNSSTVSFGKPLQGGKMCARKTHDSGRPPREPAGAEERRPECPVPRSVTGSRSLREAAGCIWRDRDLRRLSSP
ncbi:hypothetical protein MRX96_021511 [Rhipicephalus microplus]